MKEEIKVLDFGGSTAIIIPKYMAKYLEYIKNDKVTIELKGKKLIIEKEEESSNGTKKNV